MAQTVHVYPDKDLIEHVTEGDDCLCGPEIEAVPAEDGSMGWLISHHSLDGREFNEANYTGPAKPQGLCEGDHDRL